MIRSFIRCCSASVTVASGRAFASRREQLPRFALLRPRLREATRAAPLFPFAGIGAQADGLLDQLGGDLRLRMDPRPLVEGVLDDRGKDAGRMTDADHVDPDLD